MHGMENVKNLVKIQMEGSKSILTATYKWIKQLLDHKTYVFLQTGLTHWDTWSSPTRPVSPFVSLYSRLRDGWDIVVICL